MSLLTSYCGYCTGLISKALELGRPSTCWIDAATVSHKIHNQTFTMVQLSCSDFRRWLCLRINLNQSKYSNLNTLMEYSEYSHRANLLLNLILIHMNSQDCKTCNNNCQSRKTSNNNRHSNCPVSYLFCPSSDTDALCYSYVSPCWWSHRWIPQFHDVEAPHDDLHPPSHEHQTGRTQTHWSDSGRKDNSSYSAWQMCLKLHHDQ